MGGENGELFFREPLGRRTAGVTRETLKIVQVKIGPNWTDGEMRK